MTALEKQIEKLEKLNIEYTLEYVDNLAADYTVTMLKTYYVEYWFNPSGEVVNRLKRTDMIRCIDMLNTYRERYEFRHRPADDAVVLLTRDTAYIFDSNRRSIGTKSIAYEDYTRFAYVKNDYKRVRGYDSLQFSADADSY